jgi:hypothetical protein
MVLTNLQRGNIPTTTSAPEQTDVSLHHRAGQGEITAQDMDQGMEILHMKRTLSVTYFYHGNSLAYVNVSENNN